MDGGCISIWLKEPLTYNQKKLLYQYDRYLTSLSPGTIRACSFWWKLKPADGVSKHEQKQFKRYHRSEIKEEIQICGLADPMFRAAEAIMKYFGGYYRMHITDDITQYLKGEYYAIRKRNNWGIPVYDYHLVDWQFISGYFNQFDDEKIKNIYSIERFEKIEFEKLWKGKPN